MTLTETTIGDVIRSAAERYGNIVAVSDGAYEISFRDLDQKSDRLARGLMELGVEPGQTVAIWMTNCPQWVEIWAACLKIGATLVPINTRLKRDEAQFVIRNSNARVLVTMDRYWDIEYLQIIKSMVPELNAGGAGKLNSVQFPDLHTVICWKSGEGVMSLDELAQTGAASSRSLPDVDPETGAIIVYTSGTTGRPKGVVHSHRLLQHAWDLATALRMKTGDTILGHMPFYHIAGPISALLPGFLKGCTVFSMPHWIADAALDIIQDRRVAHFGGIPTHYIDCITAAGARARDLSSLKSAWVSGAPVSSDVVNSVRKNLGVAHLQSIYGMTETSGATVISGYDDPPEVACANSGKPFGSAEVIVRDMSTGEPVVSGNIGEIFVRGNVVMKEYYNDEAATRDVIDLDGWFRTGDLGWISESGYLHVTGRQKDMFIVGGSNVYPAEVERVLELFQGVRQAVVIGAPHERLGEVGQAFVEPHAGVDIDMDELLGHCREYLAAYKVPSSVIIVGEFPRTATGKIAKLELKSMLDATGA